MNERHREREEEIKPLGEGLQTLEGIREVIWTL